MKLRPKPLDGEIPTSSTADVAFLLIVFFMLTLTFSVTKGLDFAPSKDQPDRPIEALESVLVEVLPGGGLRVDGRPMVLGDLLGYLAPKLAANPTKPVILRPLSTGAGAPEVSPGSPSTGAGAPEVSPESRSMAVPAAGATAGSRSFGGGRRRGTRRSHSFGGGRRRGTRRSHSFGGGGRGGTRRRRSLADRGRGPTLGRRTSQHQRPAGRGRTPCAYSRYARLNRSAAGSGAEKRRAPALAPSRFGIREQMPMPDLGGSA